MHHCHENGVIHHDLKLENILVRVNSNGEVSRIKIADFGLSRSASTIYQGVVDARGTLEYAAPEMLTEGKEFNVKIDSWSIGVIFYNLLFGQNPNDANDVDELVQSVTT